MKLTVLGYCGGYPSSQDATSAYLLEDKGFTMLIDLGSGGFMAYQRKKSILDLDAVIISHYHADHVSDIGVLQHGLIVEALLHKVGRMVPIYGHSLDADAFKKLEGRHTKAVEYTDNEKIEIGPFTIEFMKTIHPVPCFAMRISNGKHTLVYTADTAYTDELIAFSKNCDLLLAEASLYDGQDGRIAGHMTSTEVGRLAHAAQVKSLILTHLPHYGDHEQLYEEARSHYKGKIRLASAGLEWRG